MATVFAIRPVGLDLSSPSGLIVGNAFNEESCDFFSRIYLALETVLRNLVRNAEASPHEAKLELWKPRHCFCEEGENIIP